MVIGYPLTHTQSPILHQAIYHELDIDAILLAQSHPSLAALIQSIKTLSIGLTAVTMPYKEQIIQYLDECSPEVTALKAVNTVIQRDGKLYGHNTDINGIEFALRNIDVVNKQVLVLGAGGAARAMGYFLKKQRAHILWMNRTKEKALTLAKEFGGRVLDDVSDHLDIIVNTTPIGLHPNNQASPLPNYQFNAHQIVFDMIYHPVHTTFLKQAAKQQATIISGLDMFIGQGLKQIELLTGKQHTSTMIDPLRQLLILNQ